MTRRMSLYEPTTSGSVFAVGVIETERLPDAADATATAVPDSDDDAVAIVAVLIDAVWLAQTADAV